MGHQLTLHHAQLADLKSCKVFCGELVTFLVARGNCKPLFPPLETSENGKGHESSSSSTVPNHNCWQGY